MLRAMPRRKRIAATPPSSLLSARVTPDAEALRIALDLAKGDRRRLRVLSATEIVVVN